MSHDWKKILASFSGQSIVVTGGTGMIGRAVATMLVDAGARVTVVSLDEVEMDPRIGTVLGDLTDLKFCLEITHGADAVFHLAGVKGSMEVSKTHLASHFVPTLMMNTNVLESIRRNGVARAVYTSSIGAYADAEVFREKDFRIDSHPIDFAGWAKRVGELQLQAYRTQYGIRSIAVVRPSNVYGPGDNFDPANAMVVPSLMARVRSGEKPLKVWGDGSAVRDFVYSDDVASGIIRACALGAEEPFYNLGGGGKGTSIRELVEALRAVTPFDFVFDTTKPSGAPRKIMDITLAQERLGYDPHTPLVEGLRRTWEWYLSHPDEHRHKQNYFKEIKK